MKNILICFVLLISTSALQAQVINDANAEVRKVSSFSRIDISNAFDVYLTQSTQEAVAVSAADSDTRKKIKTVVKGNTLVISLESGKWSKGNKKLKAYISFKNLEKLIVSGATDIHVSGTIKVNELDIDLSGASDFTGSIAVNELKIDVSGASDLKIKGSAKKAKIDASGASSLKGYELTIDDCSINARGASDIKITVNKELSAYASGASDIRYAGNGVIKDIHTSGAASVKKKN